MSPYVALLDACRELIAEHEFNGEAPDTFGITLARLAIARATFQPLPAIEYPSVAERGAW